MNVLNWLRGTRQLALPNQVVQGVGRELSLTEQGLVAGAMMGTTWVQTNSNSAGGQDDCFDGGGDSRDM